MYIYIISYTELTGQQTKILACDGLWKIWVLSWSPQRMRNTASETPNCSVKTLNYCFGRQRAQRVYLSEWQIWQRGNERSKAESERTTGGGCSWDQRNHLKNINISQDTSLHLSHIIYSVVNVMTNTSPVAVLCMPPHAHASYWQVDFCLVLTVVTGPFVKSRASVDSYSVLMKMKVAVCLQFNFPCSDIK